MEHLNKVQLQKGIPNKLQMRRLGPCKILAKYGSNAYKINSPSNMALSPIFNVVDLVAYKGQLPKEDARVSDVQQALVDLPLPSSTMPQAMKVLDSLIFKKTSHRVYMEHLVKWMNKPNSEVTWVPESDFVKTGIDLSLLSHAVT